MPPRRFLTMLTRPLILVAAIALIAGCGANATTGEGGRELLKVRTDVYFTGAALPLVAGVQAGIFKKHGLDVRLNEGTGSATTIQTVGNGSDDIGYADAATMVQSIGQGMDVKMIAGMVQKSPLALFAFDGSGIDSPEDLQGKTAGHTPGSAAERLFPAYAEATGIDPKSVKLRNVDIPTRDQLFMAKKTDFTFGFLNISAPNIEFRCKCKPIAMPYSEAGVQTLSSGIVAGSDLLSERPETVKKFLAALRDAVDYANEKTDEAAEDFLAYAKKTKLSKELVSEQWKRSMALHETEANSGQAFGCMAREDWKSTISLMEKYGDVPAGKVPVSDAATNSHLPGGCGDKLGGSS